jgi:hypothetical protein
MPASIVRLGCILGQAFCSNTGQLGKQSFVFADIDTGDVEEGVAEGKDIVHGLTDGDVIGPFVPVESIILAFVRVKLVRIGPPPYLLDGRPDEPDTAFGDTRLVCRKYLLGWTFGATNRPWAAFAEYLLHRDM